MAEQIEDNIYISGLDKSDEDKSKIDLMFFIYKIIRIRKALYKAVGIGLIIGIVVAISIPKQYTVKVTLSPEMGSNNGNNGLAGIAASFLGNGVSMGDGTDALNATLSADIVSSTPFLLDLFDARVVTKDNKVDTTLMYYLDEQSMPWWDYILSGPNLIIGGIKSLFVEDIQSDNVYKENQGTIELTKKEASKLNALRKSITASIDKKTAITVISVTLQDPKIAAVIADSVVHKLQESIISYRTSKAKDDCAYLEKLFIERKKEYYDTQKKYAEYVDSHDNLIFQRTRAEQERLQNDMVLAYQIYSQVANQLQVARAKVQEEKPVFAIVEPAVIPLKSSNISMRIYILIFIFLSVVFTIGWKLIGEGIWHDLIEEMQNK